MELNLNEFAKEVHANSDRHGWWETKRSYGELTALFHSELSEALEEYRAGRPNVWHAEGTNKPEGIAVELIDVAIRILDYFGAVNAHMNSAETITDLIKALPQEVRDDMIDWPFPDLVAFMHSEITHAYDDQENQEMTGHHLMVVMAIAFYWIRLQAEDPEAILIEKHEYNKTRSYKHGGKVC